MGVTQTNIEPSWQVLCALRRIIVRERLEDARLVARNQFALFDQRGTLNRTLVFCDIFVPTMAFHFSGVRIIGIDPFPVCGLHRRCMMVNLTRIIVEHGLTIRSVSLIN